MSQEAGHPDVEIPEQEEITGQWTQFNEPTGWIEAQLNQTNWITSMPQQMTRCRPGRQSFTARWAGLIESLKRCIVGRTTEAGRRRTDASWLALDASLFVQALQQQMKIE